jgi:CDGSH-type Zn-finger protein
MADDARIQIELRPDGPILVTNLGALIGSDGMPIESKEVVALCRCGGSQNKPFCDGTHKRNGFSSSRISTHDPKKERPYDGAGIVIHDNRGICAHAARCTAGLPEVFRYGQRPWIEADAATVEAIVKVIRSCPSGALSYTPKGAAETSADPGTGMAANAGTQVRDFGLEPAIEASANGPYNVRGGIAIDAPEELQPPTPDHYSLCRCGASKNKPYCDGSHAEIGFEA